MRQEMIQMIQMHTVQTVTKFIGNFFKQCTLLTQASNSLYDPDAKRREDELEKRQKEEEARNFPTQMEFAK